MGNLWKRARFALNADLLQISILKFPTYFITSIFFCNPLFITKLPKNDQPYLIFDTMDRVFSGFDKIGSPGFKTWALPRTLIDFYHFIDLLSQAGCTIVVLNIDVDANILQLVW